MESSGLVCGLDPLTNSTCVSAPFKPTSIDERAKGALGVSLDNFLFKAMSEDSKEVCSWGDDSGMPIADMRTLSRPSDTLNINSGTQSSSPQEVSTPQDISHEMFAYLAQQVLMKLVRSHSQTSVLKEDSADACPVCLETLSEGQTVQTLPCFHKLHEECSTQYFGTLGVKALCPVCRFSVALI
jgi:hypothetical protein